MMATTDSSRHDRVSRVSKKPSTSDVPPPPIHDAIISKDLKTLQKLIAAADTPQLHPVTKETPLHAAARNGSMECMKWLLDNRVNSLFVRDRDGSTPAHYCAVYGQLEALKELLTRDGKKNNELAKCVDENGLSVLALATLQGDLPMATWIIDNFPEMGRIKDTSGDLPIHFAAAGGTLDIVKLYVQKFGRKYAEEADSRNIKPVYYAAQNGKLEVLKYLLTEAKVDSKAREKGGMTIMHAATTGNQLPVIKWLIEHLGPKTILSRSYDGATPLHIASAQGYTDLLEFFIDNLEDLSDINVRDDISATPAHDAAEFGENQSMLTLLKHGADISIKDKENKTPYDLAKEKKQTIMIAMIDAYRKSGIAGLAKYEKNEKSQSSLTDTENGLAFNDLHHRTSQISNVKIEASSLMEKRKDETLSRKTSLLKLHDPDEDSSDDLEKHLVQDHKRPMRSSNKGSDTVPHEIGPGGDIYAVVDKKAKPKRSSREQMSDVESQTSFSHRSKMNGFGDPGAFYKGHQQNLETASNFSRPSRVKYYDNDAASSIGSSVSQRMETGRSILPGHYPGTGPGTGHSSLVGAPLRMPPPHLYPFMGPGGYPYPNYQYPPFNAMVAQHYGVPYAQPYPHMGKKPKTTSERMHMDVLQKSGHPMYGPPLTGFPHGHHSIPRPHRAMGPHGRGQGRMRPSSGQSSIRSVPVKRPGGHKDREIGFGPSSISDDFLKGKAGPSRYTATPHSAATSNGTHELHPPPPPITKQGKPVDDQRELQSVDENFIMIQADAEGKLPTKASEGTALHRAKIPDKYDGRYDQYIETDSEEEPVLDEHIGVATLAECALILTLGPVCGLAGISKLRKNEPVEKVSPAVFAEMEAQKTSKQWGSQDDVTRTAEIQLREESVKTAGSTLEELSDILGMSTDNLSMPSTGQFIGGSLRARDMAMKNFRTSSLQQTFAHLNKDEVDDDDMFSAVTGEMPTEKKKTKSKHSSKEHRKKSEKKRDEAKKKKKSKLIVKPSKSKKETEKEMSLHKKSVSSQDGSGSGAIEIKNTAIFDSSDDSEKEKKKSKKDKKDKKMKKGRSAQTSDDDFDEIITQLDQISDLDPKPPEKRTGKPIEVNADVLGEEPQETNMIDDELQKLDEMFPQDETSQDPGTADDSLVQLQKLLNDQKDLTPQQQIIELQKQLSNLIGNPAVETVPSTTDLRADYEAKMQQQVQSEMKQFREAMYEDIKDLLQLRLKKLLEEEKEKNKESSAASNQIHDNESDDSDSDLPLVTAKIIPSKTLTKHKADIAVQNPLKWEDYRTTTSQTADMIIMPPNPPSIKILLSDVNDIALKARLFKKKPPRKSTSVDLLNTESAIQALEQSDEEEFKTSVPKVMTQKRADVRSSTRM